MKAWTAPDFFKVQFPTTPWLVKGLISGSGWTLMVAPAKTGKTVFTYQMACQLATGVSPFLHWTIERAYRVTFIEWDSPTEEFQAQMAPLSPEPSANLQVLTPYPEGPILLDNYDARHWATARVKEFDPELVVFDALETITRQNINEHQGATMAIRMAKEVVGKRPFVMIHHVRKSKPDAPDLDPRDAAAGHHFLTTNSSATLALYPNYLTVVSRRGPQKDFRLGRQPVTPEVARWALPAPPPSGAGLGAVGSALLSGPAEPAPADGAASGHTPSGQSGAGRPVRAPRLVPAARAGQDAHGVE